MMPMRTKQIIAALPLLAIGWCGVVALEGAARQCWALFRLCAAAEHSHALAPMWWATGLPLLLSFGLGTIAALEQLMRTRRVLRTVLAAPRRALPPEAQAIVAALGLTGRVDLIDRATPDVFCYGLLRPRVLITTGLLDLLLPSELAAVLRHEQQHVRRRDPLRTLGWRALDVACWWLEPGGEQARLQRELAADRAAIAGGGRQALASALFKLLAQPRDHAPRTHLALSQLSVTDARIDQLIQPAPLRTRCGAVQRRLALPAFTLVAALLCTIIMWHAA
jgi:Zn-dependent protease with chaperone function